jgi:hypothetical protein
MIGMPMNPQAQQMMQQQVKYFQIFPLQKFIFPQESGKLSTLNATFLFSHFFVQPGRLLHAPIDGFPQN